MNIFFLGISTISKFTIKILNYLKLKITNICVIRINIDKKKYNRYFLKILTPRNLNNIYILREILKKKVDLIIIFKYGLYIPKEYINISKFGIVNLHPSNLPNWKGGNPIYQCLLIGENKVDVSCFKINSKLDSGKIILAKVMRFNKIVSEKELYKNVEYIIKKILFYFIELVAIKSRIIFQNKVGISYIKNISYKEKNLDFYSSAENINYLVNAFNKENGVYFYFNNQVISIISCIAIKNENRSCSKIVINFYIMIVCYKNLLLPILLRNKNKKVIYNDIFFKNCRINTISNLNYIF